MQCSGRNEEEEDEDESKKMNPRKKPTGLQNQPQKMEYSVTPSIA